MANSTRDIVGLVRRSNGKPWEGGVVTTTLVAAWAEDDTQPGDTQDWFVGSDGTVTMTLAVPDTGTVEYEFELPSGETFSANIGLEDGSDIDFEAIVQGEYAAADVETVASLIWGNLAGATAGDGGKYATLAAALAAGETLITLLPGTYSGMVTISQSGVTIKAYGANWTHTSGTAVVVSGNNVTLEGLTTTGDHAGLAATVGSTTAVGLYVTGDGVTLRNCKIVNPRGFGVYVDAASDVRVIGCTLSNVATDYTDELYADYAILYINGTPRPHVEGCYITGWSQGIGLWYAATDALVTGNTLINNLGYVNTGTVESPALGTRSAIEDYGAATDANHGNRIVHNYIDGSTSNCIEIAQGNTGCTYGWNTLKGSGQRTLAGGAGHIGVTGEGGAETNNILVIGNQIYGSASTVECNASGVIDDVIWEGNHFYDCTEGNAALFINDGSPTNVKIRNNVFRGCTADAVIRIQASGVLVEGNDIDASNGNGPIRCDSSSSNNRIINNRVATAEYALQAYNENIISGNHFIVSGGGGIAVLVRNNNLVSDNIIERTGGGSFAVYVYEDNNDFRGNRISYSSGAGGTGIRFDGADNRVTGNTFYHNGTGVAVELHTTSRRNLVSGNTFDAPAGALTITNNDATLSNVVEGNHTDEAPRWPNGKLLAGNTVGTSEATIAHGLGYAPTEIRILMTSSGTVWRSSASDGTNVYLTASAADRTCDVWVR